MTLTTLYYLKVVTVGTYTYGIKNKCYPLYTGL